jgi:uncharacterized protein involved in exopolysaccharide biosynthesis
MTGSHDITLDRPVFPASATAAASAAMAEQVPGAETLERLRRLVLWSGGPRGRGRRYLMLTVIILAGMWALISAYVTLAPPSFTSDAALTVPGSGAGAAVNLDRIGQASSSAASPFAGTGLRPTAIYRTLLTSDRLQRLAEQRLDLPGGAMGKPRIKLVDETPLILISLSAPSPEAAQLRLRTLTAVLDDELERLRHDETAKREDGYRAMLAEFQESLATARTAVVAHQSESGVVSVEQFNNAVLSLESLGRERVLALAQRDRARGEAAALAMRIGLREDAAAALLSLHADPVFRAALGAWTTAGTALDEDLSKWGPKHPQAVKHAAAKSAAAARMRARARAVLGEMAEIPSFDRLLSDVGTAEAGRLLQQLVEVAAQGAGLSRQVAALDDAMADLNARIQSQTRDAAVLDDLLRDLQVAEAVFRSALARIDTGKTDRFASYPMVQVFDAPTLPDRPSSPKTTLAVAGGVAASLFLLMGMGLLWIRQPFLRALLQRNASVPA